LFDARAGLHEPLDELAFCDAFTNVCKQEWFDDVQAVRNVELAKVVRQTDVCLLRSKDTEERGAWQTHCYDGGYAYLQAFN